MKYVRFEEIDNVRIVRGIVDAPYDPEATRKTVSEVLKTDKRFVNKRNEFVAMKKRLEEKEEDIRKRFPKGQVKKQIRAEILRWQPDFVNLYREIREIERVVREENLQYAEPRADEFPLPVGSFEDKIPTLKPGEVLTPDGRVLQDLRGETAYIHTRGAWHWRTIERLDDSLVEGEKLKSELTDAERAEIAEQQDLARIRNLPRNARQAEYEKLAARVLTSAALMRSEMEIVDDKDALEKSKAWYKMEIEKLRKRYEV